MYTVAVHKVKRVKILRYQDHGKKIFSLLMNLQHEHEYQKKQGRNIVAGVDELEVDDGDVVDFFLLNRRGNEQSIHF